GIGRGCTWGVEAGDPAGAWVVKRNADGCVPSAFYSPAGTATSAGRRRVAVALALRDRQEIVLARCVEAPQVVEAQTLEEQLVATLLQDLRQDGALRRQVARGEGGQARGGLVGDVALRAHLVDERACTGEVATAGRGLRANQLHLVRQEDRERRIRIPIHVQLIQDEVLTLEVCSLHPVRGPLVAGLRTQAELLTCPDLVRVARVVDDVV